MNLPNPAGLLDERFFEHRRRSSSIAGIVGGTVAGVLFLYRHFADGVWNWDLFAVLAIIAVVKMGLMIWYRLTH